MTIPKFLYFSLAFILTAFYSQAQEADTKFHRFTLDQGLSMNTISCISQDKQGFIWVGTADGLNKYDGYKFTVYRNNPRIAGSISNSLIVTLYVDKQGVMYVGTDNGGLNIYNREKDNFISYQHDPANPKSINSNRVNAILEDSRGVMWIATEKGLDSFDRKTKTFTHHVHDSNNSNSVTYDMIRALAEDKKGNLWIGTEMGISVLSSDRKTFWHYHHKQGDPKSLSANPIRSFFIDRENKIWIGTAFGGVSLFDEATHSFSSYRQDYSRPNQLLGDYVPGICDDKDGNIWFATNFGISVLNKQTNTFTNHQRDGFDNNSLVDNGLNTIFRDKDWNIWIGSIAGLALKEGLPPKFEHFVHNPIHPQSLGSKEVFCFFEDSDDRIWVGLRLGFDLFDRKTNTFKHYATFPNGQQIPTITSIYRDKNGEFWLGMYEGIARYDIERETCQIFTTSDPQNSSSTPIRDVWYMQEDDRGDLYISSFLKGIFRYVRKENRFDLFVWEGKDVHLIDPTSFYIDKQHNFWLGSARDGLLKVNREKGIYERFTQDASNPASICNNYILTIYEDKKGNFWIGTKGGLNLMNRKTGTFTTFRDDDGLPNNQINSIEEDAKGRLWLGTNNGLSCFNPVTSNFDNYNIDDGLQHNEFWHRASYKLKNGEMLFGGQDGFNIVNPSKIQFNHTTPPVYITGLQIFNKPAIVGAKDSPLSKNINELKEIILSYEQSVFSFEFVALNYIVSKKNRYAYKMEEFDKNWSYVETQRKATYTNLDPGRYTFRVRASNNDGVWNKTGTSIVIIITPPFWKTWLFKLFAALLAVATIYGGYKVKTNRINKENKRLEARVLARTREIELQKQELANNRDELRQLNHEMSNQNEVLEKKVEKRTQDLLATNEKLAASEEKLRQMLDQTLEINKKLTESEASLAEAQRIARLGSWEFDMLTRKYSWSEETYRIFGKPYGTDMPNYEEALQITAPEYRDLLHKTLQETIEHKKSFEIEVRINTDDDKPCWLLINGKPIENSEGKVYKLIGIIMDNTGRKLAEEQLKHQNQELRKINAELDRFVYRASHDLRAPLSSLLGLIAIFKMETSEVVRARYLEMMEKSIGKLDAFIQSIISYSKNSRLEVSVEPIDFQELFDETFENFKYMERSELIDKKLTVVGESAFYSDPFRLKIIFNNLISNAIRYSNPSISSYIHITVVTEEQKVSIEFEDNGCGIAEESLDKVFEMFYRASETNVGSGLGLYIVKEVIQTLDGSIQVQSRLGRGTTFTIQLPNMA
jgi:ligand-binding sensor domain-containing protein/nitrogen-specific signal transduction histidine kinase